MSDKFMHGSAYFGLGVLWMIFGVFSFEKTGIFKKIVIISIISVVFGIFVEVLQHTLTSYRRWDLYDIIANSIGVVLAGIIVWITRKYLIRLKAKFSLELMKN